MKIILPKRFKKYVDVLVLKKFAKNENEVLIKIFKEGLEQVSTDMSMGCIEPDMDLNLIKDLQDFKEKLFFEIPDNLEDFKKIELLSKTWKYSIEHTKAIVFVTGLANDGYFFLLHNKQYEIDLKYRDLVDNMPHELALEPKEKIFEEAEEDDSYE